MKKTIIISIALCTLILILSVQGLYLYNTSLPDEENILKSIYLLDSALNSNGAIILECKTSNNHFLTKKIEGFILSPFEDKGSFSIHMTKNKQKVIKKDYETPRILKHKDFIYNGQNNIDELDSVTDEQRTSVRIGFKSPMPLSDYVNDIYKQIFDIETDYTLLGTSYKSSDDSEDYVLNLRGEWINDCIRSDIGALDRYNYTDVKEKNAIDMTLGFLYQHNEICKYIQNTGVFGIKPIDFEKRYSYIKNRKDDIEILGFTLLGKKKDILKLISDNENVYIIEKINLEQYLN